MYELLIKKITDKSYRIIGIYMKYEDLLISIKPYLFVLKKHKRNQPRSKYNILHLLNKKKAYFM